MAENNIKKTEIEYKLSFVMGKQVSLHNPDILNLTLEDLKKSYYKRAKELHPDRALHNGLSENLLTERFKRLADSYSFLLDYWQNRDFSSFISQNRNQYTSYKTPKESQTNKARPTKKNNYDNSNTRTYYHGQNTYNKTAKTSKPEQNKNNEIKRYYTGPMPQVEMRFAQYLYYSKKIDWNTFIHSLTWQWKQRPRMGELAVEKGFLKHQDVLTILRHSLPDELFGKAAIRLGFLSEKELFVLLGHQQLMNKPIGQYFIEECRISKIEIEKQLQQMKTFNAEVRMQKQKRKK